MRHVIWRGPAIAHRAPENTRHGVQPAERCTHIAAFIQLPVGENAAPMGQECAANTLLHCARSTLNHILWHVYLEMLGTHFLRVWRTEGVFRNTIRESSQICAWSNYLDQLTCLHFSSVLEYSNLACKFVTKCYLLGSFTWNLILISLFMNCAGAAGRWMGWMLGHTKSWTSKPEPSLWLAFGMKHFGWG